MPDTTGHFVLLPGMQQNTIVISYGGLVQECMAVQQRDPSIALLVVNRLRPLEDKDIVAALGPYQRIIVVEDHFPSSGLYGSLCEIVARHALKVQIQSLAPRGYTLDVGTSNAYFHRKYELDADGILAAIASAVV
jgi:transketolase C-terminal domain/subunit